MEMEGEAGWAERETGNIGKVGKLWLEEEEEKFENRNKVEKVEEKKMYKNRINI